MQHENWKEVLALHHLSNQIVKRLIQRIFELHKSNIINEQELQSLQTELNEFQNICGGCERIRNTP
jgi:putative membrane protein